MATTEKNLKMQAYEIGDYKDQVVVQAETIQDAIALGQSMLDYAVCYAREIDNANTPNTDAT